MIRTITFLLVAASLAACSSPEVWRKTGASEQAVRADTLACQGAAQRGSDNDGGGFLYEHLSNYNYFQRCMSDHGYQVSLF